MEQVLKVCRWFADKVSMESKQQTIGQQLKGRFDSFNVYRLNVMPSGNTRKGRKLDTVFYLKGTTVDEVLDSEYRNWLGEIITVTKGRK